MHKIIYVVLTWHLIHKYILKMYKFFIHVTWDQHWITHLWIRQQYTKEAHAAAQSIDIFILIICKVVYIEHLLWNIPIIPSMRPPKSHLARTVYNPMHPRQPQQLGYQWLRSGVPAKHDESPCESSTSKQPFQMMVDEVVLHTSFLLWTPSGNWPDTSFLLPTPATNYFGHGLPIYWSCEY
jgi:hypothetical protein